MEHIEDEEQALCGNLSQDFLIAENNDDLMANNNDNPAGEESKWWDSESQNLLDSQQLVEGLSLCDDLLRSQSPGRNETENEEFNGKPCLSDYSRLGPECLKKDLEACQELVLDPANIELDTPPDFRLSQLVSDVFCLLSVLLDASFTSNLLSFSPSFLVPNSEFICLSTSVSTSEELVLGAKETSF